MRLTSIINISRVSYLTFTFHKSQAVYLVLYWIEFLWILLSKVSNISLVIMVTDLMIRCRLLYVLFSRRLKSLCSIHSWSLFRAWYRIWRKKVIHIRCNFLVIVFRDHFNFRVIIWSWQHMRVHASLCLCEIIEDRTPCGLSLLLVFPLNIRALKWFPPS